MHEISLSPFAQSTTSTTRALDDDDRPSSTSCKPSPSTPSNRRRGSRDVWLVEKSPTDSIVSSSLRLDLAFHQSSSILFFLHLNPRQTTHAIVAHRRRRITDGDLHSNSKSVTVARISQYIFVTMSSLPDPHTIEAFFATPCYDAPKRGIGGVVKTGAWDLPPAPKWNAPPSLVTGDAPTTGFDSSQTSWSSDDPPDLPQWGDSVANEWIRPVAEPTRETVDIWDFLEKYENQYQAERETRYIVGSPERPTLNQRRKNAMKNQNPSKNQKVSAMERVPDSDRLYYAPKRVYGEKKKDAWSDAVSFGRVFSEFQNAHTLVIGLFDDVDPLPIRYLCDEIWESNDGDMVPDWFLRPYLLHPEWIKRHPIFPQPNPNPPPPPNQPPPPQAPHRHPDTPPQRSSTPTPRTSRQTRSADQLRQDSHRTRGSDTRGTRPRSRIDVSTQVHARGSVASKVTVSSSWSAKHEQDDLLKIAVSASKDIWTAISFALPHDTQQVRVVYASSQTEECATRDTISLFESTLTFATYTPSSISLQRAVTTVAHPQLLPAEPQTEDSSPLTPLSSLSDELPDSLPPTTPHEEGEPQFVHDDGLHAEDDALERIQPAAKEFGLGIAMSTMDDDIAPMVPHALVPEDVEMDNDTPQGEGLVVGGTLPHFDPFTEYLYFRFGFTHPSDGPPYKPLEAWDEHLRKALYHFVEPALARVDPPAGLWDLNYANPRFLNRNSARVEVTDYTEMEGRPLYRLRSGCQRRKRADYLTRDINLEVTAKSQNRGKRTAKNSDSSPTESRRDQN
ncbi:hypothetical protein SCHPADRAFT_896016 [Schizopora paradoxa]|uniref:Uncharacterized protein n=1 Tax=Schizopora paradoxa TaxID=27342 RepID=A0A0H2R311_9AGAM|nr:hypothetical protein SCHPADRAFT_896016 [Schizopora paradoxa]